ncbi:MAG: hypothetical protein WD851_04805 [Pirellulales bacterium]
MTQFLHRFRTALLLALAVGLTITPTSLRAQEDKSDAPGELKTIAVVALSGYDNVMENVGYFGGLVGQPEAAQTIEGMLNLFTQNKGLVGVDKTRPWGMVLQTDGMQFVPVGCLPVTSLDELLELAVGFGVMAEDAGDGVQELAMEDRSLFVKQVGDWAFLSQSAEALASAPTDPMALLKPLVEQYTVGAHVKVRNVPEMYRQIAIQQMRQGMEQGLQRLPDESDEEFDARREMTETQLENIVQMIEEIDELTVGWAVSPDEKKTSIEFALTAVPDTKTARQLTAASGSKTNFAGFIQPDAAATLLIAQQVPSEMIEEQAEQMKAMMKTFRLQAAKAIEEESELPNQEAKDTMNSAIDDFMSAVEATILTGKTDAGAVLHIAPDSFTLVAGGHVVETDKIESGLKKVMSLAEQEPDFPGVKWNAESYGGLSFHTVDVPIPADEEEARQMFGEQLNVAVGLGADTAILAVGKDYMAAVKKVLDDSKAQGGKEVKPAVMSVSVGAIMKVAAAFVDEEQAPQVQMMADMLETNSEGLDHIRIEADLIPNGLKYRFEAEEGVIKAIGAGVGYAQQSEF